MKTCKEYSAEFHLIHFPILAAKFYLFQRVPPSRSHPYLSVCRALPHFVSSSPYPSRAFLYSRIIALLFLFLFLSQLQFEQDYLLKANY